MFGCLFVILILTGVFCVCRKLPKEARKKTAGAVQAEEKDTAKDTPRLGAGDAGLPLYEVSRV